MRFLFARRQQAEAQNVLLEEHYGVPLFYWIAFAVFAVTAALALWFVVDPAPPKKVTIVTGPKGGFYDRLGKRFKTVLEQNGMGVELRLSKGSVENLALLQSDNAIDVGFIQGGVAGDNTDDDDNPLRSLATLAMEPVWIFTKKGNRFRNLEKQHGIRIAIGAIGSGTRDLARHFLAMSGIAKTAKLLNIGGNEAASKLLADEVDAVIFVSAVATPWVQRLLNAPGVSFVRWKHATALVRIFPFLSDLHIPARTFNFQNNIPPEDVVLVGASTNLVVRTELHSAIKDLLLQTAKSLRLGDRQLGTFERFPNPHYIEFPLDPAAQRYFEHGPTLIRRYFPFWASTLIERFWILGLPIITILLPLLGFGPPLLQWQMRRRVYLWYKDLNHLETAAGLAETAPQKQALMEQLLELERQVADVGVPLPYMNELYRLRMHIDFVRTKLTAASAATHDVAVEPTMPAQRRLG